MSLNIGLAGDNDFTLPEEAVTGTFGILAMRGVGKTHTAVVMAEELIGANHQTVILDPLDVWWGLRADADGKGPGLSIYVFGGDHADLPLESTAGALIADVIVEQGICAILSLRHLSKTQQRRFVADFAEQLYYRKGEAKHRTPLHLIIDEADSFAPQRVMGESARMFGAIDDLVRRGRTSGIGVTLISQRAAALNKDVLTQIDVLVCLRTVAPQDRKALDLWIQAHDSHDQREMFMESLAVLPIGTAWFWSPGWLHIFDMVEVRQRNTFDSSATPKIGEVRKAPARLAQVDINTIVTRMQELAAHKEATKKGPAKSSKDAAPNRQLLDDEHKAANAMLARLETSIKEKDGEIAKLQEHNDRLAAELTQLREAAHAMTQVRQLLSLPSGGPAAYALDPDGSVAYELDEDSIVQKVLARIPSNGAAPAQVAAPEALRKKYLQETVDRIYEKISALTEEQRKAMEILLSEESDWSPSRVAQAIHGKATGSSGHIIKRWQSSLSKLASMGLAGKVGEGGRGGYRYHSDVHTFARNELAAHSPTDQEIALAVQHVLAKLVT